MVKGPVNPLPPAPATIDPQIIIALINNLASKSNVKVEILELQGRT